MLRSIHCTQTPGSVYSLKASRRCTKVLHISKEVENPSVGSKTEIRLWRIKVKNTPGRENFKCKSPEAETNLTAPRIAGKPL